MSVTTLIKTELDRDNKTIDKILFYLEQHKTILNKTAILFLHKKIQLLHKCVLINEIILQQYEAGDLVECRWCGVSLLVSGFLVSPFLQTILQSDCFEWKYRNSLKLGNLGM